MRDNNPNQTNKLLTGAITAARVIHGNLRSIDLDALMKALTNDHSDQLMAQEIVRAALEASHETLEDEANRVTLEFWTRKFQKHVCQMAWSHAVANVFDESAAVNEAQSYAEDDAWAGYYRRWPWVLAALSDDAQADAEEHANRVAKKDSSEWLRHFFITAVLEEISRKIETLCAYANAAEEELTDLTMSAVDLVTDVTDVDGEIDEELFEELDDADVDLVDIRNLYNAIEEIGEGRLHLAFIRGKGWTVSRDELEPALPSLGVHFWHMNQMPGDAATESLPSAIKKLQTAQEAAFAEARKAAEARASR